MRFSHCPSQHLPEKPTFAVGAFGSRYGKAVELEWAAVDSNHVPQQQGSLIAAQPTMSRVGPLTLAGVVRVVT